MTFTRKQMIAHLKDGIAQGGNVSIPNEMASQILGILESMERAYKKRAQTPEHRAYMRDYMRRYSKRQRNPETVA